MTCRSVSYASAETVGVQPASRLMPSSSLSTQPPRNSSPVRPAATHVRPAPALTACNSSSTHGLRRVQSAGLVRPAATATSQPQNNIPWVPKSSNVRAAWAAERQRLPHSMAVLRAQRESGALSEQEFTAARFALMAAATGSSPQTLAVAPSLPRSAPQVLKSAATRAPARWRSPAEAAADAGRPQVTSLMKRQRASHALSRDSCRGVPCSPAPCLLLIWRSLMARHLLCPAQSTCMTRCSSGVISSLRPTRNC